MFKDRMLTCCNCSAEFIFSAGEQDFFHTKGLTNEPKRCQNCRVLVRAIRNGLEADKTTIVDCADCGAATRVPFRPTGRKPVYCSDCFRSNKLVDSMAG